MGISGRGARFIDLIPGPYDSLSAFRRPGNIAAQAPVATLQKAGLITSQKVGQWHFFKRNDAIIESFVERIGQEL